MGLMISLFVKVAELDVTVKANMVGFLIVSLITWKSGAQKMGCQKQNLQRIARANCQTMHLG